LRGGVGMGGGKAPRAREKREKKMCNSQGVSEKRETWDLSQGGRKTPANSRKGGWEGENRLDEKEFYSRKTIAQAKSAT